MHNGQKVKQKGGIRRKYWRLVGGVRTNLSGGGGGYGFKANTPLIYGKIYFGKLFTILLVF